MRRHLPSILAFTLLWGLFFAGLLSGQMRLPNSDLSGQFHTFARFQAAEMWAGRLPLWSPGSFAGFPFAADTQAAVFYPPRWLTILLAGADISFLALTWEGLLHIWLAGLFTYALAYDQTRSRGAALLAAVGFALGGYLISYPLLQLAVLETIAWLPLLLWLVRRGVLHQRVAYLLGAALLWGMSLAAGHPQTFVQLSYLLGAYYLFLAISQRWAWRWVLGLGVGMVSTAVFTSAPAWLPALHYLTYTTRSTVTYDFVASGFPLIDYLQLITPNTLSFWVPMYSGILTLLLALGAWLGRRAAPRPQHAEILFWTGIALFTLLLSLGDKGLLFRLLYYLAPGLALFRQQERWINLFSLSLALLAAQGFVLWWRMAQAERQKWLGGTTAVFLTLLLLTSLTLAAIRPPDWLPLLAQQLLITLLALLLLWRGAGQRWGAIALILLLTFDLALAARAPLNLQPESPAVFWSQPDWLTYLPQDGTARVDGNTLFHLNLGELYGVEDMRGLSPLKFRWLAELERVPNERRWQLLNVTHVLAGVAPNDTAVTPLTDITQNPLPGESVNATLYQFDLALPRAWLVHQAIILPDESAAFAHITHPDFNPATQVILTNPTDPALWQLPNPPNPPNQPTISRPHPAQLEIHASTPAPAILVLSEWDYPGWQVEINQQPATRARANGGFQAIYLPAGDHTISLRYRPWDVPLGVGLALLNLLIVVGLMWRWHPTIPQRAPFARKPDWGLLVPPWLRGISRVTGLWLTTALSLLAFTLRAYHLGHQELRGDEAFSYLFARLPLPEIIPTLIREGDPHSPFHYLLLHGWLTLTGDSEYALRYLSLLASFLLVPLIYALGTTIGRRPLGLLSALLIATSSSLIWLGQDVRNQYNFALFFATTATLILLKTTSQKLGQKGWLLYALCAALAVYSHYYSLFILMSHALYLGLPRLANLRQWGRWLASGMMAALLFAPWLVVMLGNLLAAGQLSDPAQPELAAYLLEVGIELAFGSALTGWWVRWLFVPLLGLALLGVWGMWRRNTAVASLLIGWWGFATLFIYLIRFSRATFNPFYISIAAPAWWLLVACGLLLLWQQRSRLWQTAAVGGLALILLANGVSLWRTYFDPAFSRTVGYRAMAAQVLAQAQPGDVFLAHFPDPSLHYYLRHAPMPVPMLPESPVAPPAETEAKLAELAQEAGRIWFVPYLNSGWDGENVVGRWLDYHLLPEADTAVGRLNLFTYRPIANAASLLFPVGQTLGAGIGLPGVYATLDGQPSALLERGEIILPAGQDTAVALTLLWQPTSPIPENYTAFVHFLDHNSVLIAQHDGVPLFGTRPTSSWQPNEQLLDQHELIFPARGEGEHGRVLIGLYHSDTLERLGVIDLAPWRVDSGR
jgi:hypothetical protein